MVAVSWVLRTFESNRFIFLASLGLRLQSAGDESRSQTPKVAEVWQQSVVGLHLEPLAHSRLISPANCVPSHSNFLRIVGFEIEALAEHRSAEKGQ
jgi:hypothetical protein